MNVAPTSLCCCLAIALSGAMTREVALAEPLRPAASAAAKRYALDHENLTLDRALERVVARVGGSALAAEQRLAVALVDLSDQRLRYAAINGDHMMYAASLPKIAILLGAFDALEHGTLVDSQALRGEMERMIRVSDNNAASSVLRRVGFSNVAATLTGRVGLYDAELGGLWVGKAYGLNEYWRRDPIANLSHGATARQVARFFVLLQKGQLLSRSSSAQMKAILGNPGINHKFVRGLSGRPGHTIYRKSGSWHDYHADAALIEHGGSVYVAVGLVQDANGERLLQRLIAGLDELICGPETAGRR